MLSMLLGIDVASFKLSIIRVLKVARIYHTREHLKSARTSFTWALKVAKIFEISFFEL